MSARLLLEDGTLYFGRSIGFSGESFGEIVFNTALTGYQEILTDPSYRRQILVLTTPHIGNYGIQPGQDESPRCWLAGLVVRELSPLVSHWRSRQTLDDFLKEQRVVAIDGIDTRDLTRRIRERGSMKAGLFAAGERELAEMQTLVGDYPPIESHNLALEVSGVREQCYPAAGQAGRRLAVIDCGVKEGILRQLAARGCDLAVYPPTVSAAEVLNGGYQGLVFSNGPGDPQAVKETIALARAALGRLPILGICLGHQMLALALGARTYKLKFGHHGSNHPVKNLESGRVEITSQNHNFAVDEESLQRCGADLQLLYRSLFDGTVEGFFSNSLRLLSLQFHPEAAPGPFDSRHLFDRYLQMVEAGPAVSPGAGGAAAAGGNHA